MKINITKVTNPTFSSEDQSSIDCVIETKELGAIPFTCMANDCEEHGQKLWKELNAGDHGPIKPHVKAPLTKNQLISQAQKAISKSDVVATRCMKSAIPYPEDWKKYDNALRLIISTGTGTLPTQPAYPANA